MSIDRDELLEIIEDLSHDLGKHIRLPLLLLPADASPEMVAESARTALLRTRRGPSGVMSAAAVWQAFLDETAGACEGLAGWPALVRAVERALGWRQRLEPPIDRAHLTADLSAIAPAIRALEEALTDG